MMKKGAFKKRGQQRKKAKHDNLCDNEKEQLRKYEKEGKKVIRDNLDGNKKEKNETKTTKEKRKA